MWSCRSQWLLWITFLMLEPMPSICYISQAVVLWTTLLSKPYFLFFFQVPFLLSGDFRNFNKGENSFVLWYSGSCMSFVKHWSLSRITLRCGIVWSQYKTQIASGNKISCAFDRVREYVSVNPWKVVRNVTSLMMMMQYCVKLHTSRVQ